MLLNSSPSAANSSWPWVSIGEEKSPPASLRAACKKRPSCAWSALDATSAKARASNRKPMMNAIATARLDRSEALVADRSDRTVTSTGVLPKPGNPRVAVRYSSPPR